MDLIYNGELISDKQYHPDPVINKDIYHYIVTTKASISAAYIYAYKKYFGATYSRK